MNTKAIYLGTILGIPIRLDYSWFLIFAFVTWNLAVNYYPVELGPANSILYWSLGALTAILLFGSVLLHELGHSAVAQRYRITVRQITLFLFGGVAEITSEPSSPSAEFLIAIAGPLVSFGLAAISGAALLFVGTSPFLALAKYLAVINGSLALFNLVPGFPLDGGRIFRALVWGLTRNMYRATQVAAALGRVMAFLFMAAGIWQTIGGDFSGLWFVMIGWYLESAARGQLEQQKLTSLFSGHRVSEVLNKSFALIPAETSIQSVVDNHILAYWQRALITRQDNTVAGVLSWHEIQAVPRARWQTTSAGSVMLPLSRLHSVGLDTELKTVVEGMTEDGTWTVPVVADGQILGTVGKEEVMWFLQRARGLTAST